MKKVVQLLLSLLFILLHGLETQSSIRNVLYPRLHKQHGRKNCLFQAVPSKTMQRYQPEF